MAAPDADALNPEQRRAVDAVRGPVCILAGAGSGKTTTITHRIANQVRSGAFVPEQLLAVTFTEKAAGELRARLAALGVPGARASTFHAAALAQLSFFGRVRDLQVLSSKALPLRWIGNGLPMPHKFRPAADLATEVEWAKNRRLTPDTYLDGIGEHAPPLPAELMQRVFRDYERRKQERGLVDFEDLLELAIRLYDEDPTASEIVRRRYQAITVDEYQDVNLLQQTLLDAWLGDRDELCAVGDDYQAIYGFTGATPEYLLRLPERFPGAVVVRLESNYRSTPGVLEFANRLVPRLGGAPKTLRATRPAGPQPVVQQLPDPDDETAFVVERIRALHGSGVPYEEMVLLHRTNARSAAFEEALTTADVPFQGAALLDRDAARQLLKALPRARPQRAVEAVRATAVEHGLLAHLPPRVGEREVNRQNDLRLLVTLAERLGPEATVDEYVVDLRRRFAGGTGTGVHLLTYHRAKGLEFDAVFLPRLNDRELPSKFARTGAERAEERRLLYVGITRAREHLTITWAGKASAFLGELGVHAAAAPERVAPDDPLLASLKRWRLERAKADGKPAYVVFHDATLAEIAARRPATPSQLGLVPGVGPAKLERYGADVLAAVAAGAEAPTA